MPNPFFKPEKASSEVEHYLSSTKNLLLTSIEKSKNFEPRRNIPFKSQTQFKNLLSDLSITICPADKNCGPVITYTHWYKAQTFVHLLSRTYREITHDSVIELAEEFIDRLNSVLDRFGHILPQKERDYLTASLNCLNDLKIPKFYILVKIHKTPVVGRPILACHSWITKHASRWIHCTEA